MKMRVLMLSIISGCIGFGAQAAEPAEPELHQATPVQLLIRGVWPLEFKISEQLQRIGNRFDPVVWEGEVPVGDDGVFVNFSRITHPLRLSIRYRNQYIGTAHIDPEQADKLISIEYRSSHNRGGFDYLHLIFVDGTELDKPLKR